MNNVVFCNDTTLIYHSIIDLCSNNITLLSKEEVGEIYNTWNKEFNCSNTDFIKSRSIISNEYTIPADASHIGIDLPTWINFNESETERRKIMIVGIDPLRNNENQGNVEFGTPYAFHRVGVRTKGTNPYWQFIEFLAKDFSIYLTDIYKVFYYKNKDKSKRSYNDASFTGKGQMGNNLHRDILKCEIEIIKPDLIIALGKQSTNLLINPKKLLKSISSTIISAPLENKFDNKIPIMPMVHLSGLASKYIATFLKNNNKPNVGHGKEYYNLVNEYFRLNYGN